MYTVEPLCCLKTNTQIQGWIRKEETKLRGNAKARDREEKEEARDREEHEDREELGSISLPVKTERQKRESESDGEPGRWGIYQSSSGGPSLRY